MRPGRALTVTVRLSGLRPPDRAEAIAELVTDSGGVVDAWVEEQDADGVTLILDCRAVRGVPDRAVRGALAVRRVLFERSWTVRKMGVWAAE